MDDEAIYDVIIEEPVRKCHNVRAAAVAQLDRAFVSQAEGLVFESQPRHTQVVKTGSDSSIAKRSALAASVKGSRR